MARITNRDETKKIYEQGLNENIIYEGLYSILPQGVCENKENPVAFVTRVQNLKANAVHGVFEAIISWDGMAENDICPVTIIGTTMIVEPIKLYNI
jgi:hypothetical protein